MPPCISRLRTLKQCSDVHHVDIKKSEIKNMCFALGKQNVQLSLCMHIYIHCIYIYIYIYKKTISTFCIQFVMVLTNYVIQKWETRKTWYLNPFLSFQNILWGYCVRQSNGCISSAEGRHGGGESSSRDATLLRLTNDSSPAKLQVKASASDVWNDEAAVKIPLVDLVSAPQPYS